MSKELTYNTGNYILTLTERERKGKRELTVEMHKGRGGSLVIPGEVELDGELLPVTAIAKKAFLGNRSLRQLTLPASVRRLSDWSFAQCEELTTVISLRKKPLKIARGAFDDCRSLQHICLGYTEPDGLSRLLGACPVRLSADYLLESPDIGSAGWFQNWDTRLSAYLDEEDEEGYTNVVLCGEEDIDASVPEFVAGKRRSKAALCLMRLAQAEEGKLAPAYRKKFTEYIMTKTKGCASEEAWEVILHEFGDRMEYYELLARLGGITEENIDAMLEDLSEQHAEAKAYLIRYKQENLTNGSFFDSFSL